MKPSVQYRIDSTIEDIDRLITTQLRRGEPPGGYSCGDPTFPDCPWCLEKWHGLPITVTMLEMRKRKTFFDYYSYSEDNSPWICPGSNFHGPEHITRQWDKELRNSRWRPGLPGNRDNRSRLNRRLQYVHEFELAREFERELEREYEHERLSASALHERYLEHELEEFRQFSERYRNRASEQRRFPFDIEEERLVNSRHPEIKRFRFNPPDWLQWNIQITMDSQYPDIRDNTRLYVPLEPEVITITMDYLLDEDPPWKAFVYGHILYRSLDEAGEPNIPGRIRRPDELSFAEFDLLRNPIAEEFHPQWWIVVPRTGVI